MMMVPPEHWNRRTLGLEYSQVCTRPLATKQELSAELWKTRIILCGLGIATPTGGQKMTQSTEPFWYVICMPYGVGGEWP